MYQIAIVNKSTVKFDLNKIVHACQRQITLHVKPYWGVDARLAVFDVPPKGWIVVNIVDDADQAGVLGYHSLTDDGMPIGWIFAKTILEDKQSISVTLSHELIELLGDPTAAQCVQVNDTDFWAWELCDAVENDSYLIDGVEVSNFVLPGWFNPLIKHRGNSVDYLNKLSLPLTLSKGGYMPVYRNGQWTQIFGSIEKEKAFNHGAKTRLKERREKHKISNQGAEKSKVANVTTTQKVAT